MRNSAQYQLRTGRNTISYPTEFAPRRYPIRPAGMWACLCLGCTAPEPRAHRPEAHTAAGPSAAGLGQPSQQQGPGPSPWGLLGAARARACPALAIALMINNMYCGSSPQITSSLSSQSSSSDETEGSLSSPSLSGHASSINFGCSITIWPESDFSQKKY